jgi:predicted membrane metal-binding protein
MHISPSIFKAYDIRGIVPTTVHGEMARALGRAFGTLAMRQGERTVAVGRDGRLSGPMLAAALSALITAWWRRGEWRRRPLSLVCPAMVAGRWGGLLLAAGYAVFSGWGLPAQRTVLMLAVSVLLRSRGLRWPWWITWLTACAVVLAWDPWAWLQAGFWLSFVAVGLLMAWEDRHPSAIDGAAASAPLPAAGAAPAAAPLPAAGAAVSAPLPAAGALPGAALASLSTGAAAD